MQIINPATEALLRELPEDTESTVLQKCATLKAGQVAWARTSLVDRVAIIRRFSELLQESIGPLAAVLTAEVGKPLSQAQNEINGARARIQWLTDHASTYLSEEVMIAQPGLTEKIVYEPLGVVANISAWNYPYLVGVNVFVPALLAGNAVLYKPSEFSSLTGLEIEKLLHRAGVPANVFQVALGARAVGEQLLDAPLDGYFFTGSYATGRHIYERVASRMVPCQCELGGKDPLYVADDVADVKAVAEATADGAFYNNGQSCCAVERIYVHEKVYDEYVHAFVAAVQSWKVGDPTEAGTYFGPLSRKSQVDFLSQQVSDAVQKGAQVLLGGKPLEGKGYYFAPTVLVDVNHTMRVMQEESFGPVIGIMKVADDAAALALMKDTPYGLTASVYSRDQHRAEKMLHAIDAGTGYWNCCDRVSAAVPWSGRKHSGFGATLSHAGLRAFTRPKALHLRG